MEVLRVCRIDRRPLKDNEQDHRLRRTDLMEGLPGRMIRLLHLWRQEPLHLRARLLRRRVQQLELPKCRGDLRHGRRRDELLILAVAIQAFYDLSRWVVGMVRIS